MKKKKYIIVGDNNFWYSTTGEITEKELEKELEKIKEDIQDNVYAEYTEKPSELYAYEAKRLKMIKVF